MARLSHRVDALQFSDPRRGYGSLCQVCNGVLTGVTPLIKNLPCRSERTFYHPSPLRNNRLRILISLSQPIGKQLMEMMLIVTSLISVLLGDVTQ